MIPDRIEREIVIDAPPERVWSLMTEPEFWVAKGDTQVTVREGALLVSDHPDYGRFPQRIEKIEPERYIAFRWASTFPGEEPRPGNSTLVEYTLTEEDGKTRLRVVESGFATLAAAEDVRRKSYDGNTEGWAIELDAFRKRVEQQGA